MAKAYTAEIPSIEGMNPNIKEEWKDKIVTLYDFQLTNYIFNYIFITMGFI